MKKRSECSEVGGTICLINERFHLVSANGCNQTLCSSYRILFIFNAHCYQYFCWRLNITQIFIKCDEVVYFTLNTLLYYLILHLVSIYYLLVSIISIIVSLYCINLLSFLLSIYQCIPSYYRFYLRIYFVYVLSIYLFISI